MRSRPCAALAASVALLQPPLIAQSAGEAAPTMTLAGRTAHFSFYSDPWINLHHFLYWWARDEAGLNRGRRPVALPERRGLALLSEEHRAAWQRALAFYRQSVARKGHFDDDMLALKDALVLISGDFRARPPDSIPGVAAALSAAMPVYRGAWWPQHDKSNRAWVEQIRERLQKHEQRFVEMSVRVHGSVWPPQPWRVDVSAYANFAAGYTTSAGHVVAYSTDPGNQQLYALETVLHEIQHASVILGTTREALGRSFGATAPPPNLWHALIFATAGEFVRSLAEAEGLAPHVPYWIKEGFESFPGWSTLVPAVGRHWLPVVRGELSREEGLAALARSLNP